jgi:hypothetical protein
MTTEKNEALEVSATSETTIGESMPAKSSVKPSPRRPVKPATTKAAAKRPVNAHALATDKGKPAPSLPGKNKAAGRPKRSEPAEKPKKLKLVRDSFTMPASEYELIAQIKKRLLAKGVAARKSEILRAAVVGFAATADAAVIKRIGLLTVIKTGRPAKGKS